MLKKITLLLCATFTLTGFAKPLPKDGRVDIWPTIPFIRGADLCKFSDSHGQTRSKYMSKMVAQAERLMMAGMNSKDVLPMLVTFNNLYDKNQELAQVNLDVTLESSFKAFIDGYYRDLTPKEKKISFTHVNNIVNVVNAAQNGQRDGYMDAKLLTKLDYIAYGTYTMSPNCTGNVSVTLHMVGRNGKSESYRAVGSADTVMSQIASEIFTQYQRSQFPSSVRMGRKQITLVGGLNGSVDKVSSPELAEEACAMMDARLPNRLEMELLDSYGDWSGGISLGTRTWAFPGGKVYNAELRNPSPVREKWEVNDREFYYYCVK